VKEDIFKPMKGNELKSAEKKDKERRKKYDIEEVQIGYDSAGQYEYFDTNEPLEDGDFAFRAWIATSADETRQEPRYFSTREAAEDFIDEHGLDYPVPYRDESIDFAMPVPQKEKLGEKKMKNFGVPESILPDFKNLSGIKEDFLTTKGFDKALNINKELDRIERYFNNPDYVPNTRDLKIITIAKKLSENQPLSVEEISMITGMTRMGINKMISRSLGKLRKRITKDPQYADLLPEKVKLESITRLLEEKGIKLEQSDEDYALAGKLVDYYDESGRLDPIDDDLVLSWADEKGINLGDKAEIIKQLANEIIGADEVGEEGDDDIEEEQTTTAEPGTETEPTTEPTTKPKRSPLSPTPGIQPKPKAKRDIDLFMRSRTNGRV
jgi:hypothetical protein